MKISYGKYFFRLVLLLAFLSRPGLEAAVCDTVDIPAGKMQGNFRAIVVFHKELIRLHINHDYYERPGGHSWTYWTNALPYHLLFFRRFWNSRLVR